MKAVSLPLLAALALSLFGLAALSGVEATWFGKGKGSKHDQAVGQDNGSSSKGSFLGIRKRRAAPSGPRPMTCRRKYDWDTYVLGEPMLGETFQNALKKKKVNIRLAIDDSTSMSWGVDREWNSRYHQWVPKGEPRWGVMGEMLHHLIPDLLAVDSELEISFMNRAIDHKVHTTIRRENLEEDMADLHAVLKAGPNGGTDAAGLLKYIWDSQIEEDPDHTNLVIFLLDGETNRHQLEAQIKEMQRLSESRARPNGLQLIQIGMDPKATELLKSLDPKDTPEFIIDYVSGTDMMKDRKIDAEEMTKIIGGAILKGLDKIGE